jgi:ElaB/YqjD/DUF883 family membrane-anchored ribosome-binding protein
VTQKVETAQLDDLKDDLRALRKDLDKLVRAIGKDAESMGRDTLEDARKRVKELASNARERSLEGVSAAEAQIEQNPFTSIATAFGVGLVIGRLLHR